MSDERSEPEPVKFPPWSAKLPTVAGAYWCMYDPNFPPELTEFTPDDTGQKWARLAPEQLDWGPLPNGDLHGLWLGPIPGMEFSKPPTP